LSSARKGSFTVRPSILIYLRRGQMMQNGVGFFRCSFPNSFFFSFLPTFPKANRTRRITGTSFNTKSRHRSRGPFVSSQIVTIFLFFSFFLMGSILYFIFFVLLVAFVLL
jgi:hypothetical protein